MSGRNFQCPLKNVAHRIDVSKAALAGNSFHAVLTFFQSPARRFHAQAFHKFRGCGLHFFGEDPGEIARTHRDPVRQHGDGERFVQVIEHPCNCDTNRLEKTVIQSDSGGAVYSSKNYDGWLSVAFWAETPKARRR